MICRSSTYILYILVRTYVPIFRLGGQASIGALNKDAPERFLFLLLVL